MRANSFRLNAYTYTYTYTLTIIKQQVGATAAHYMHFYNINLSNKARVSYFLSTSEAKTQEECE